MIRRHLLALLLGILLLPGCVRTPEPPEIPRSAEPVTGIAYVHDDGQDRDIHLIQPDGSGQRLLVGSPEADSDPAFSPDGRTLAFRSRRDGSSEIYLVAADGSGEWVNLVKDPADSMDDEFSPAWHPSGELLALFTDRFQPPLGDCRGSLGVHHLGFLSLFDPPFQIQQFEALPGEQESVAWSPDGRTLAFGSICQDSNVRIYLWDRETGELTALTDGSYGTASPSFSPDGRYLAFSAVRDGPTDIMLYDLETGALTNLTQSPARERYPAWSPDGQQLAFTSDRDGSDDLFVMRLDGSGLLNLTHSPGRELLASWAP